MKERTFHIDSVKEFAFVITMGALGNVLALSASYLGNIHPQIALDLSHIATFIVALNLGAITGFATGCIAGIFTYYRFGLAGYYGPIVGLPIIPLKGITGLFSGLLAKRARPFFAVTLGFIPECVGTFLYMKYFTALFLPIEITQYITMSLIIGVLIKAWVEIGILGLLMEILQRNQALRNFMNSIRAKYKN